MSVREATGFAGVGGADRQEMGRRQVAEARHYYRARLGTDCDGSMVELHSRLKWFRSGRVSELLGWRMPDESHRLLGYAVWDVQEIIRGPI